MDLGRQQRLADFVDWCRQHIHGDEKGEAQIFMDRLFQAFGNKGCLEVGGTPEFRIRKKQDDQRGTAFADYVWKPIVLIEMKKRGEDLTRHYRQAFDYWIQLVPNRPRYVILCNFDEFWIYDFDVELDTPLDKLELKELPDRYGPLAFLFPTREQPHFKTDRIAVTQKAADLLSTCYNKLKIRQDVGPQTAQRFILQMLVALFSEDIGLLPKYLVTQLLDECTDPPKAFDLIGGLFTAMNTRTGAKGGRYRDVPYFNGGLFAQPAPVELAADELSSLKHAAEYDWSDISPEIFGTIFQHSMNDKDRHKYGAQYTSPADIMKIIGPTIVQPWRQAVESARSIDALRKLHQRLQAFRVLDPACGSGNFLYLAYRELKFIEADLIRRIQEVAPSRHQPGQLAFGFVTSRQFFGIDIIPFAVELAKVTLTLAHKLAIDELHVDEQALPLDNLDSNIVVADALIDSLGNPAPWPAADVIIGNPPYLGAKKLKPEYGPDYVNKLRKAFPEVPGMADYCVYWFRRAHDHLPQCTPDDPFRGRAGLVGTQNIRNNQSRVGGLDHVVKSGTIVEAVDNLPWSGEANVHVSIANWVKHAPLAPGSAGGLSPDDLLIPTRKKLWHKVAASSPLFEPPPATRGRKRVQIFGKRGKVRQDKSSELAIRETDHINSALSDEVDVSAAKVLSCNTTPQTCFQGVVPGYDGFVIDTQKRTDWLKQDKTNADATRLFLIGRDLLTGTGQPSRAIVDFADLPLFESQRYSKPFIYVQKNVLPAVRKKAKDAEKSDMADARKQHLDRWWQFWNVRTGMRSALRGLKRYMACSRVTKRPVFAFIDPSIVPDGALQVFAFTDDYSFGILQSDIHWQWFITKCSKLKSDFRYTPDTVFDTFPWPQSPTTKQIDAVAEAGRQVRRIREVAMKTVKGGSLRAIYRTLELPGDNPLKDAHAALDEAVMKAYGFSPKKDLLQQLLDLNLEVAARIENNKPVTAPGIPPAYPDPKRLITKDCIRPA